MYLSRRAKPLTETDRTEHAAGDRTENSLICHLTRIKLEVLPGDRTLRRRLEKALCHLLKTFLSGFGKIDHKRAHHGICYIIGDRETELAPDRRDRAERITEETFADALNEESCCTVQICFGARVSRLKHLSAVRYIRGTSEHNRGYRIGRKPRQSESVREKHVRHLIAEVLRKIGDDISRLAERLVLASV